MIPTKFSSLLKIALATFAGAFFGALSLTQIPTTLDGWRMLLAPALGAALAAEIVFIRSQLSAFLTANTLGTTTTVDGGSGFTPVPAKVRLPPILPTLAMAMVLATFAALSACSLFTSSTGKAVVGDIGSIASCIIEHIDTDPDPTFEGIAGECSPAAVGDVVSIVTALTAPDAGTTTARTVRARLVHHKAVSQ